MHASRQHLSSSMTSTSLNRIRQQHVCVPAREAGAVAAEGNRRRRQRCPGVSSAALAPFRASVESCLALPYLPAEALHHCRLLRLQRHSHRAVRAQRRRAGLCIRMLLLPGTRGWSRRRLQRPFEAQQPSAGSTFLRVSSTRSLHPLRLAGTHSVRIGLCGKSCSLARAFEQQRVARELGARLCEPPAFGSHAQACTQPLAGSTQQRGPVGHRHRRSGTAAAASRCPAAARLQARTTMGQVGSSPALRLCVHIEQC